MIGNLISALFIRTFVAACNLAILLITSRHLGSSVLGQVSLLVLNVTIIQTLLDIYTGPSLVHFIPRSNLRQIYGTGLLWTITGVMLLNISLYFLGVGSHDLWPHLLGLSFMATLHAFHLVIILARKDIRGYNFLVFLQPAIMLVTLSTCVYVFGIISLRSNIIAMYAAWGIALIISSFIVARVILASDTTMDSPTFGRIIRNGAVNQLGNLAHILSNRYNYYILSVSAIVGVYSAATSLVESAWIISASVSPIVLTHVANRAGGGESKHVTFLLAKICFLVSLLFVTVLVLVPQEFFIWLLGGDFSAVREVMLYLAPGVLCISFSSILSHYFSGLGRQRVLLAANICGLLVTLCASYALISRFGILGACYTASMAYFMQFLVLTVVFMRENGLGFRSLFSFGGHLGLLKDKV